MQRQSSMAKRVLYRLKRDFGLPAKIIHQTAETVNYSTGIKTITKQFYIIRRAILLPTKIQRSQIFGTVTTETSAKNFSYGDVVQLKERLVIIDHKDLGPEIGIENWYMIISGSRYEIVSVDTYTELEAWIIRIKHTEGSLRDDIVALTVHDRIIVAEMNNAAN